MAEHDPNYVPSGPNTPNNPYYKKINHVKIARQDSNRAELLTSPIAVKDGGVAVAQHSYTHGDLINTHPDYATISLTTNYESIVDDVDVGIASVVFTEDNITIAGTGAVTEFRYIRLVVTDLAVPANVRTYTIDTSVSPVVSFLSDLQPRSIAIGSPVGRIDFNDGVTGTWNSWVLAAGSDPIPQGRTLLPNGYINNFDATSNYTGTLIATVTDGLGTSVDVSIDLQFAAAAIPTAVDTFSSGTTLATYVGESQLSWTDQRGNDIPIPPVINSGALFADPDGTEFSYYHYDTTLIGDAYIRADITYGPNVNTSGTFKSVAEIGLAMGSGGEESGVYFGYRAEYDRWELRRISVSGEQSSVFIADTTGFNVNGQTRTLGLGRAGGDFEALLDGVPILNFTDNNLGAGCGGFRLLGNSLIGDDMSFDNVTWPADPTYAITAITTPAMSNFGADSSPVDALSANALEDFNYVTSSPGTAVVEAYTRYVNDIETPEGEEHIPVSAGDVVRFEITVGDDVIEDKTFVTNTATASADAFSMIRKRDEFIASSITATTTLQEPLGAPWLTRTPLSGTWPFTLTTADLVDVDDNTTPVPMVDPVLEVPDGAVVGGTINVLPAMFAYDGNQPSEEVLYTVQANSSGISGYTNTTLDIVNSYVIRSAELGKTIRIRAKVNGTLIYSNEEVITAGTATVPDAFIFSDWGVEDATTGGTVDVTITSLPADGGATITDVEYKVDAGAWTTSGGTTDFSITGLTDDAQVGVMLRAVNAEGNGDDGNVETVTPTTAGGSFTEVGVVSDGTFIATAPGLITDRPKLMHFLSAILPNVVDGRTKGWGISSNMEFRTDSAGSDGLNDHSYRFTYADGTNSNITSAKYAQNVRTNILMVSELVDNGGNYGGVSDLSVWQSGTWVDLQVTSGTSATKGPNYILDAQNVKRWSSNAGTSITDGTYYRDAFWTFDAGTSLPVFNQALKDMMCDPTTGALVDPAVSQAAYGTAQWDFYRDATDQNLGLHDGSLGSFTNEGSPLTDEV